MNKKISVIVPVYNAKAQLSRCIDSILNQTIIDQIEIVVIDDGSTDGSSEILQDYAKKHPESIVYHKQKNAGVSAARNKGLELSSGLYIGFVDSDDYIADNMYQNMLASMETDAETDLVVCGRYIIYSNGSSIEKKPRMFFGETMAQNHDILNRLSTFIWDKLFRKDVIENNHIQFPLQYHYAEDYWFTSVYKLHCKKVRSINESYYYYSMDSSNSLTNTFGNHWFDIIKVLEAVCNYYEEHDCFELYKQNLATAAGYFYVRRLITMHQYGERTKQVTFVRSFLAFLNGRFGNDWLEGCCMYKASRPRRIRGNRLAVSTYCLLPHSAQRAIRSQMQFWETTKNDLSSNKTKYAKYRKRFAVNKKQVFFMSYYGGNITDSPYYMMEDLYKRGGYDIYVGSGQPEEDVEYLNKHGLSNVHVVEVHSDEFVKIMATAGYIIYNSRIPAYVSKRPGQVFVNTWHGTPLKTLGQSMSSGLSDIGNNQTQFLMSDYLLYPNDYTMENIMRDFSLDDLYSGKVILSGYPRNAALFRTNRADEIRHELGLEGKRIYVYMPTWRGTTIHETNVEEYKQEVDSILEYLDAHVDSDAIIFVKLHQIVMKKIELNQYKHILPMDSSKYETYEFLSIADSLITDYSSVLFDFAVTGRDIILFMYDYDKYITGRGMYLDVLSLPFAKIYNVEDLAKYISENNATVNTNEYNAFLEQFCCYDSKDNAKNVNDVIFEKNEKACKVIDFSENTDTPHPIVLFDNSTSEKNKALMRDVIQKSDSNTVFVFKQKDFSELLTEFIKSLPTRPKNYLVIPDKMPVTAGDKIISSLHKKLGIFKKKSHEIVLREFNRTMYGIKIGKVITYTRDKRFEELKNMLNN